MSILQFNPHDFLAQHKTSADWIGLRSVRELTSYRVVRLDQPDKNYTDLDQGVMIEVLINGHFGYAGTADLSRDGLKRALDRAIESTRAASQKRVFNFTTEERPKVRGEYKSLRQKNLDETSLAEITDSLMTASRAMSISDTIANRVASAMIIQTQIDFFSTSGTEVRQNFDMVNIDFTATAARGSESQTRTYSLMGQWGGEVFDKQVFAREAERIAKESLELLEAENCPEGKFDLLLYPDQMILQIHESIGHPLEMDRILGDERNYAGWSFVKPEDFGKLQYGSSLMNVTFDPTQAHEFASYAFDDSGNPATKEFLIKDGVLLRGLGSLESQRRSNLLGVANFRSASWNRAPIDRMANINLEPGTSSLEELVSQIKRGVIMKTNRSWSIDDYRNKFQFGCEYGLWVEDGHIVKTVKNPNYRGVTVDFWNRLIGVGKADLVETYGSPYCGKGEPNQVIRVGHSSPPCLFREVEVFGGHS